MPLMAAYEQNDARDSARLLAERTLESFDIHGGELAGNAVNNMYRLLQSYRSHGFYGYAERSRPNDDGSVTSLFVSSDRNVGELKQALDDAFETVFKGKGAGDAIDGMRDVLRSLTVTGAAHRPDSGDVAIAKRFFEILLEKLRA